MPRERENVHVNSHAHFDGQTEDILNDPTASAGSQMGIEVDPQAETAPEKSRNPFTHEPQLDPEMKPFEEMMRGTKKRIDPFIKKVKERL